MERLGDELLAHVRAVRVCSVNEVDPELDGSAQHSASLVPVGRIAPYASAGDAHCAEAETVDRQVATDVDRSRVRRRYSVACWHLRVPLIDQNSACQPSPRAPTPTPARATDARWLLCVPSPDIRRKDTRKERTRC